MTEKPESSPGAARDGYDRESRTRTHLANERTFLAWLRTGVTLIALGLVAAQFLATEDLEGLPVTLVIAILLVLVGIFLALTGAQRYFHSTRHIENLDYRPPSYSVAASTALLVVVGILAIVFILSVRQ